MILLKLALFGFVLYFAVRVLLFLGIVVAVELFEEADELRSDRPFRMLALLAVSTVACVALACAVGEWLGSMLRR